MDKPKILQPFQNMKKIIFFILIFPFFVTTKGNNTPKNYNLFSEVAPFAQSDLYWAYNTLISLEDDATLITTNETEANILKYVQFNKKLNQNTQILTFSESKNTNNDFFNKKNTYITLSMDQDTKEKLKSRSYLTGLAFKLSETPFDNISLLKNNVEQKFLLDYLKVNFEEIDKPALISKSVYLVPFSVLYRFYKNENNQGKTMQMRTFLSNITSETGNEAMLPMLLGENAKNTIRTAITTKNLEKGLIKIRENLYAAEYETSNEQYNLFLQDLVNNKEFDKINVCRSEKVNWRSLLNPKNKNLSDEVVYVNGHPDNPVHPIQNISYDAAKLYCAWITEVYNMNNSPKKKYKKVVFRLPTPNEWETAVNHNPNNKAKYPWGNDNPRTEKGCFLQNFNLDSDVFTCPNCAGYPSKDGGFFSTRVDAYYPTSIGLYQTIGNIAEMTAEKGIAKGGSWEDEPDNCTIKSVKTYEKPSPAIGFRVFMEIQ